jgi:hypothetical protein
MRLAVLIAAGLALITAGCAGYRMGSTNGAEAGTRTIRVAYFENQTLEPRLSEAIANAMRKQFQLDGTYRLVTGSEEADVLVTGKLTRLVRAPVTFDPRDTYTTRDEEMVLFANVLAVDRLTNAKLLDREVIGRLTVRILPNETAAEHQAIPQLAGDFASKAVPMIVDGSW